MYDLLGKKYFYLFFSLLVVVGAYVAFAVYSWIERQPTGDVNKSWMTASSDSDGSNLIFGDNRGRLYTSADFGVTWTERQPARALNKFWQGSASDDDGSNLIVGANRGRLYTSADFGVTWTERQPAGDVYKNWFSVASDDDGSNLFVGAYPGRLYTSADFGVTWTERQPAGAFNKFWQGSASDDDGSNLSVGAYPGRLYTSADFGVTWTERQPAGAFNKFWGYIDFDVSNLVAKPPPVEPGVDDLTPPTVTTLSPEDDATGVSTTINLVITFSETVDVEAGVNNNIIIKKTSDDSIVETIDAQDATVTGSGTPVITINPATTLDEQTDYYVEIGADAFDDTNSNSYAGISNTTSWSFTTGDFTEPTVTTLSPEDDATGVSTTIDLVITFSETVDAEDGVNNDIIIKKTSDDSIVETIDAQNARVTGSGTPVITINPATTLDEQTEYYVEIGADAFDDTNSNSYAGISNTTSWSFTTGDFTPPTVLSGAPSGSQSAGTTQVTMSLTTDENTTCRYSSTLGTAFIAMTAFTTTGTTNHSTSIAGLSNSSSYSYYALCQDGSNNESVEATISFSVASAGRSRSCYGCRIDPVEPIGGFKLDINQGATLTSNRIVTLNQNAGTDIKKMRTSMRSDFSDSSQEEYQPTKQWDLCSSFSGLIKSPSCPDGKYIVNTKFYTTYGRTTDTAVVSSSIILQTTQQGQAPSLSPFVKYLRFKDTDLGVKQLQIFLNKDPDTQLANSGLGSPGKETTYFGLLTKKAVIKFQEKYATDILIPEGLTKGTGFMGQFTTKKINELIGN